MQFRNNTRDYGLVAQFLHWGSVTLLLVLYLLVSGLDVPPKVHVRDAVVSQHVALGLGFTVLMLVRLAWRLGNPNPARQFDLGPWRRALVFTLHRTLYVVLLGEAALGMLAHVAGGGSLPLLGNLGVMPDALLARGARAWHDGLASALLLLVVLHASAAVANLASATARRAHSQRG